MTTNTLAVDPSTRATLLYVPTQLLGSNPYRDFGSNPIDLDKIKELISSIKQTGFWPSILGRPKNNMIDGVIITPEVLMALVIANDPILTTIEWEVPFAHHRVYALKELEYLEIPITPQIIDDSTMMRMLALENKEGFGSSMNSQLENVKQVSGLLTEQLAGFETYDAYDKAIAKENRAWPNASAFSLAKKDGVSPQQIVNFLGGEWTIADIRNPHEVLQAFEDGVLLQTQIAYVRNMSLLKEVASIAKALYNGGVMGKEKKPVEAPDWPIAFKLEALGEVITKCSVKGKVKDEKVTVRMIQDARKAMLNAGTRPDRYLSTKKESQFSVYDELRKLLDSDKTEMENIAVVENLLTQEGYQEWPGIQDMVVKLSDSAKKMAKDKKSGGKTDGGGDTDGDDDKSLDPSTRTDVDAALKNADGSPKTPDANADFSGDDDGDDYHKEPINKMAGTFIVDLGNIGTRAGIVTARRGELEVDDNFAKSVSSALTSLAIMAQLTLGREAVLNAFRASDESAQSIDAEEDAPEIVEPEVLDAPEIVEPEVLDDTPEEVLADPNVTGDEVATQTEDGEVVTVDE